MVYAESTNLITEKNKANEVIRVDTTWKEFPSVRSFMNTSFTEQGAIPVATLITLLANQIKQGLYNIHRENIENGIAIEQTDENQ
jgi:hypothetical protein